LPDAIRAAIVALIRAATISSPESNAHPGTGIHSEQLE
jgi:hypothetical protein